MPNRLSKGKVLVGAIEQGQFVDVTLTNANMVALRATPISLVAAPGAGKYLQFIKAELFFDYTAAYGETTDDLGVKYTNGTGAQVSQTLDATGFLTATADAYATIAAASCPMTANAPLVLHNLGDGEYTGGNASNVVKVRTWYRVITASQFPA